MKIFLVRMYLDSGWVNFYNQTTKEKIIKYIKKRGCVHKFVLNYFYKVLKIDKEVL